MNSYQLTALRDRPACLWPERIDLYSTSWQNAVRQGYPGSKILNLQTRVRFPVALPTDSQALSTTFPNIIFSRLWQFTARLRSACSSHPESVSTLDGCKSAEYRPAHASSPPSPRRCCRWLAGQARWPCRTRCLLGRCRRRRPTFTWKFSTSSSCCRRFASLFFG
jgi:hypothetical protein